MSYSTAWKNPGLSLDTNVEYCKLLGWDNRTRFQKLLLLICTEQQGIVKKQRHYLKKETNYDIRVVDLSYSNILIKHI